MSGLNLTVICGYSCTECKFPQNLFQQAHNTLLLKSEIAEVSLDSIARKAWWAPWPLIWGAVRMAEAAGCPARTVTRCSFLSLSPGTCQHTWWQRSSSGWRGWRSLPLPRLCSWSFPSSATSSAGTLPAGCWCTDQEGQQVRGELC